MPRLFFRAEARTELAGAIEWYSQSGPSRAARFAQAFNSVVSEIIENPRRFPIIEADIRRARIEPYPYGIMYFLEGEDIVVISCFHGARHPRNWRDRRG